MQSAFARSVARSAALLACGVSVALAATDDPVGGVRAAEDRWSEAFVSGDSAALDQLLDAEFVSINGAGKPRTKAEIIALASAYATAHPGEHAKPLPSSSTIRVIGEAALVQHRSGAEVSVDVFYRRDGHWRAWYSQHTRRADGTD